MAQVEIQPSARLARAFDALRNAGKGGLTKSELAQQVWGAVNSSTQSMASRVTEELRAAMAKRTFESFRGELREIRRGRQVVVSLWSPPGTISREPFEEKYALAKLREGHWRRQLADRPLDRPYAHVADAAKMFGALLDDKDEHDRRFAQVLLRILDEGDDELADARADAREIQDFARGWKDPRKDLAMALATFVNERERDFMADDLVRAYDAIEKSDPHGVASLLWAAMALTVARRVFLLGGDRALEDHSRLLRRSRKALDRAEESAPVHVAYWRGIAKITTGKLAVDAWSELSSSAARPARAAVEKILELVREDELRMAKQGRFNAQLSRYDTATQRWLRPEVDRVLGFAAVYAHDHGAPVHQAEQWAREHSKPLREALLRARDFILRESRVLVSSFAGMYKDADPGDALSPSARFQVDQARFLLDPDKFESRGLPHDASEIEYDRLIRNNYWTPGQLWTHIAIFEN